MTSCVRDRYSSLSCELEHHLGTKICESRSKTVRYGTARNRFYVTGLTKFTLISAVTLSLLIVQSEAATEPKKDTVNNRPIIGVLAQEWKYLRKLFPNSNYTSYIAAYVKGLEAAGTRVVPIMIGKDREYYKDIMSKINGVLLPGGNASLSRSAVDGYSDAGGHIYDIAIEMNNSGDYFPIYGICLGFQLLVVLASGRGDENELVPCNCHENLPLDFVPDFRECKMFKEADDKTIDVLKSKPITVNSHDFCVVDANLVKHNLTKDWMVTSYGDNKHGVHFIVVIESNKYPFYGTQFHPEKGAYEWEKSKHYPSYKQAIIVNRYFYDFFVDECRKNFHSFSSTAEENKYLIYNFMPLYTGRDIMFEQCYAFSNGTS